MRTLMKMLVVLLIAVGVTACGDEGATVSEDLATSVSDSPSIIREGELTYAIGHAVVVTVPDDWTEYGPEFEGEGGTTWEWAVGQPEATLPLPAGLQFSFGQSGKGAQVRTDLAEGARELAEISPGYQFLDEGKVDIPGADEARFLRFKRDLEFGGSTHLVEQVSLMIQVNKSTTTTIRFIAPAGEWDDLMKMSYESVQVAAQ